jgi:hypothetical protein
LFSSDAPKIAALLAKHRISSLYHFTSVENLPSILLQEKLCSKAFLEELEAWPPARPGGNETSHKLDKQNGNWNLISVSFSPYSPMVYRRKKESHLCFLEIKPEVAERPHIQFSNTNAASRDVRKAEGFQGLELVDLERIQARPLPSDKNWHRAIQAEMLVPKRIPLNYVRQIAFISEASMDFATYLCRGLNHPKFAIVPPLFEDFKSATPSPDFSWVGKFWASPSVNRRDLASSPRQLIFSRHAPAPTVIAEVNVQTGDKSKVLFDNHPLIFANEYSRQGHFYNLSKLPIDRMADGSHTVTYVLNDQRWAVTEFQIVS